MTGCTLYPKLRDQERALPMVLDTAKPKNRKRTIKPGMRGRDAARKLTLKVDISKVFTIDFSEIQFIVNQLAIGWTEQKCKDGLNLHKKTTEFQKIPKTMVSP